MLEPILRDWDERLKQTPRLETIRVNRLLESELEANFIEALRRPPREGEPLRTLSPDVINGKQGWYLKIAGYRNWLIEPQVELGPAQGVAIKSRVDFLFHPERPTAGELPIAVFTDGYEWHADPVNGSMRTGVDSAQRLAIAKSGKYLVWSLAWDDVQERLSKPGASVAALTDQAGDMLRKVLEARDEANRFQWMQLYAATSFDWLIHLLGAGRGAKWQVFAEASWMNAISVKATPCGDGDAKKNRVLMPHLPQDWNAVGGSGWMCRALERDHLRAFAAGSAKELRVAVRLLDEEASAQPEWKTAWREFLRQSNLLQFIPGGVWVTTTGLRNGFYGALLDAETLEPKDELEDFLENVVDQDARVLVRELFKAGCVLPVPGYEMADAEGEIYGMSELAWVNERVAVLSESQVEFEEAIRGAGWQVFTVAADIAELAGKLSRRGA